MFIAIVLLFYVLPTLNAPTWCFVLAWITFGVRFLGGIVKSTNEEIKKRLDN